MACTYAGLFVMKLEMAFGFLAFGCFDVWMFVTLWDVVCYNFVAISIVTSVIMLNR